MQKSLIRQRFTKSLKSYHNKATVQKKMAEELASLIDMTDYSRILELGCGTGFLTDEILKKINITTYDAVDIVKDCKKYMENISDKINFICCDIEDFPKTKKYDLIVSNATLQWVEDLPDYINMIKTYLEGEFIFTLFGENNFKEMSDYITNPLKYYSIKELKDIFKDFKIEKLYETKEVLEFDSPVEILHHIKDTGVNALSNTRWTKSDLSNFEATYERNKNNKYSLTYHPIYVKLTNRCNDKT